MKKSLFLLMTLTVFIFGASNQVCAQNSNSEQTQKTTSKQQTTAETKDTQEKREEDKKEAERQRKESGLSATDNKKTKKKHKKFLGIF